MRRRVQVGEEHVAGFVFGQRAHLEGRLVVHQVKRPTARGEDAQVGLGVQRRFQRRQHLLAHRVGDMVAHQIVHAVEEQQHRAGLAALRDDGPQQPKQIALLGFGWHTEGGQQVRHEHPAVGKRLARQLEDAASEQVAFDGPVDDLGAKGGLANATLLRQGDESSLPGAETAVDAGRQGQQGVDHLVHLAPPADEPVGGAADGVHVGRRRRFLGGAVPGRQGQSDVSAGFVQPELVAGRRLPGRGGDVTHRGVVGDVHAGRLKRLAGRLAPEQRREEHGAEGGAGCNLNWRFAQDVDDGNVARAGRVPSVPQDPLGVTGSQEQHLRLGLENAEEPVAR